MSTSSPLPPHNKVQELLQDFLAGYWSERTRANYAFILAGWLSWCTAHNHDPLAQIDPAMLEGWIGELRARSYAPNTIAGRVSAVSAFYRWCVRERLVHRNPVEVIRRPRRPTESTTLSLTRHELTDWLAAAERRGGAWWAAAMLPGLNGLRCGELVACDVTDVGSHSWHHTLALRTTKGDKPTVVALAPPTMQALAAAIAGRTHGPLLLNGNGRRMTAYNVQYLVAALARDAGINKRLTPHGLRHSAITVGLDAGVSLRDMQDFARHADPKTTRRYDRARHALNRHATYAISHHLAGGT
ncbi:MAG: tyrosine-type recombinase/integrase [Euzebyaceae bacterium]|nr:tyrosine-type recombinase/integrase [Euzebyaceae bacterium]